MKTTLIPVVKDHAFHNGNGFAIPIEHSSFPYTENKFKPNTCWKTEIVDDHQRERTALLKVIEYEFKGTNINRAQKDGLRPQSKKHIP